MGQSAGRYNLNSGGEVGEFIERLALLPLSAWIGAASTGEDDACEASAQNIESLITRTGRQIDAWSVTDGVETTAHIAFGSMLVDKRFLANKLSATRVARRAALALLLRSELSSEDFEHLYRPFRDLIPLNDLSHPEKAGRELS